jgi:hypothetical protein
MAVYKFSTNSLKTPLKYSSLLAGNAAFDPGVFQSIATTTLSTATGTVTFSSIPQTYTHLQLRVMAQTNRGTYGIDEPKVTFNGDTGSNYKVYYLFGNGSTANASSDATTTFMKWGTGVLGTTTGANWGSIIVDILDYTNTNKYTTSRVLGGTDCNGTVGGLGGRVGVSSGLWMNTAAITSISLTPAEGTTFSQYSSFALYGIKGA